MWFIYKNKALMMSAHVFHMIYTNTWSLIEKKEISSMVEQSFYTRKVRCSSHLFLTWEE